jgi:hypothetical protein
VLKEVLEDPTNGYTFFQINHLKRGNPYDLHGLLFVTKTIAHWTLDRRTDKVATKCSHSGMKDENMSFHVQVLQQIVLKHIVIKLIKYIIQYE